MYSLVQFDSGEYYKRVKIIQGRNCIIKYKNGTKYSGCLVDTSESEGELKKLKKKMEFKSFQSIMRKQSHDSVAKDNHTMQLVSCSTPINKETPPIPIVRLSNIFDSSTTHYTADDHIVQQISCSTLINNKTLYKSDSQLSSILNNNEYSTANVDQPTKTVIPGKNVTQNSIVHSDTSESTVPSGATEILNIIGDDWLTFSTENNNDNNNLDNNSDHNYNDQGNSNECDNNDELAKNSD